jgi:hypothetical protein
MTEQRPEFEEVPVVRLGHPADARRAQAATIIVVVMLAVLIAKPWGETRPPAIAVASPSQVASLAAPSIRPAETVRPDGARIYDPALFGRYAVTPRWEIWPTAYVYKFGLSGPLAIDSTVTGPAGSSPPEGPPASPPPGAGQLIDVGAADLLMVLGLNTPSESRILDARLWQFPSAGPPVRRALRELPPPWPVNTFHVYGLLSPGDADPNVVAAWTPGVYRLDLLVDPGAEIRRIGLLVRHGVADQIPTGRTTPEPAIGAATPGPDVRLTLSESQLVFANLGGTRLAMDLPPSQRCGLMELWLAESDRPNGPCSAIATSDVSLVGIDLGPNRPVEQLAIERIDPVAAPVDVVDRTSLADGASGGHIVQTADGRPLAEGTYRLVATLADGSEMGWYFRVLPASGG